MNIRHLLLIALIASCAAQTRTNAAVGDRVFEVVPPPNSVLPNDYESDVRMRVFRERVNHTASASFRINASGLRTVDSFGDYNDSILRVGTRFDSYFIHVDSLDNASKIYGPGTLTFDEPIIGVVGRDPDLLTTSDLFGAPGTLYPTVGGNHFDLNNNPDFFTLLPDGHSIRIQAQVGPNIDQLRVLTAPSVPEPTTIALLVIGGLAWCINRVRLFG